MIRLEIEIKDEKFFFTYNVGDNNHSAERPICAEVLCAFTAILKYAAEEFERSHDKIIDGIKAKNWVLTNPDEARELLKKPKDQK